MGSGDDIQIDKGGFVRIHYEILELLAKAPLRGQQFRCLMFLFRKTYGFNKKEEKISLQQWADGTEMRRQNVWRELQTLIKGNVIYMKSSGPKRPNTWGFNKHYEQWNIESVIEDDDKSVITDDYRCDPSVITIDDKSVITPHEHTKDSKDSSSSAAAAKKPFRRTVSDFVSAYERIWGLTVASPYIGEQINEWEARVTFDGWCYALEESAKTRNAGNWKYFGRILERLEREGYQPKQEIPQKQLSATVSFALEELV